MKRNSRSNAFIPFIHEDIETKNGLLNVARELAKKTGIEYPLSSTLIFAEVTEYLAQHLLTNLRYLAYKSTYDSYGAIVFLDQRDREQRRGLGETIDALREFEFPDKQAVLQLLVDFNKSRNHFIHEFISINAKNVNDYDKDTKIIRDCTEDFINKLNAIYAGLTKVTVPLVQTPPAQPAQNKKESNGTA